MLNWALRYAPVLAVLDQERPKTVLEVGSGSNGLAHYFTEARIVSIDLAFEGPAAATLARIQASVLQLPFGDRTFEAVVCTDVLEHIAPADRDLALQEMLRVCARTLVVAYPSGFAAEAADRRLGVWLTKRGTPVPGWLREHFEHPYPGDVTQETVATWDAGCVVDAAYHNTNVQVHYAVMRAEFTRLGRRILPLIDRPRLLARLTRFLDNGQAYRRVFVVRRRSDVAGQY